MLLLFIINVPLVNKSKLSLNNTYCYYIHLLIVLNSVSFLQCRQYRIHVCHYLVRMEERVSGLVILAMCVVVSLNLLEPNVSCQWTQQVRLEFKLLITNSCNTTDIMHKPDEDWLKRVEYCSVSGNLKVIIPWYNDQGPYKQKIVFHSLIVL